MLTKENLKGITENYVVMNCNYLTALQKLEEKFDLILVDPPYASGVYETVLNEIYVRNLLAEEGVIVLEHPNGMAFSSPFEIFDQKRYGTVTLTYLKEKDSER